VLELLRAAGRAASLVRTRVARTAMSALAPSSPITGASFKCAPFTSAPVFSNVRLISILAASLLAGYAGDEAYNVWWRPGTDPSVEVGATRLLDSPAATELAQLPLARES